jgi:hypothetical protein
VSEKWSEEKVSGTGTLVRQMGGAQQLLWYIISGTVQSSEGCLALVFVSARPVQLIVIIINNILVIISVSQGILVG